MIDRTSRFAPHRPLGLAASSSAGHAPHEVVEVAAQAGFDFVSLRVSAAGDGMGCSFDPRSNEARRVARSLAATGLDVLDIETVVLDGQGRPGQLHAVLEAGAALGARVVVVTSALSDRRRLTAELASFTQDALAFGLVPAYEPRPGQPIERLAEASLCAREAGCLIMPDSVHSLFVGEASLDLELVADLAVMARLGDVAACDIVGGAASSEPGEATRCAPGDGAADLHPFLSGLPTWLPLAVSATPPTGVDFATFAAELYVAARAHVDMHALAEFLPVSGLV